MENRNEVLRVSNKQIIASGFAVIFTLTGIISFLAYIIANHLINAITVNSDTIDIHTLEIAALHSRSHDCQKHIDELYVVTNKHINNDDERMDRNEKNINTLEQRYISNKDLINECRRAIWR